MSDILVTGECEGLLNLPEAKVQANNAQYQQVNDLHGILKLHYDKYIKYKIISDTIEECIKDESDLDSNLKSKIEDIVHSANVKQYSLLGDNDKDYSTLLGLSDTSKKELNYVEKEQLLKMLELKLNEKYKKISEDFRKTTNRDIKVLETLQTDTTPPLQMEKSDKDWLELKKKLTIEQEQYVKNLLKLQDLLDEATNLKLKKLPVVTQEKIKECELEQKINCLKSEIVEDKIKLDIFTETENSLRSYKALDSDLKQQQKELEKKIQELRDLKDKYDKVSCKQYDDILKSYIQIKSEIEKKKLLFDFMKN